MSSPCNGWPSYETWLANVRYGDVMEEYVEELRGDGVPRDDALISVRDRFQGLLDDDIEATVKAAGPVGIGSDFIRSIRSNVDVFALVGAWMHDYPEEASA